MFKGQSQSIRVLLCQGNKSGMMDLGLINQCRVMAEIHIPQIGMTIQAQWFPHKRIELAHQEIRQVKRRDFVTFGKSIIAFEK